MSSRESVLDRERATVAGGRLGRIVAAYALAAFTGALARTFGLIAQEIAVRGFRPMIETNGLGALVLVPLFSALVTFLSAAPFATAFLVFAESAGARSRWLYLTAGAAIGPLAQGLIDLFDASARPTGLALYGLAAVAGAVAGWVYWTVAVRAAPLAPRPEARPRAEPRL